VLRVPSVVTEGREYNLLINPLHRNANRIEVSKPELVRWDLRLFHLASNR
jgi:RES domain-containing protein